MSSLSGIGIGPEMPEMQSLPMRVVSLTLTLSVVLVVTGCSGGTGTDGAPFFVTGTASQAAQGYLAKGVYGLNFQVVGPASTQFQIMPEYQIQTGSEGVEEPWLPATWAPAALQMPPAPVVPPNPGGATLTTGPNGTSALLDFYWYAGADLGFLAATVRFRVTAYTTLDPLNGSATPTAPFTYDAGLPSVVSAGAGAGTGGPVGGTGRAGQTAHAVRPGVPVSEDDQAVIAGGYNNLNSPPNAFDTATGIDIDGSTFAHTLSQNVFPGSIPRVLHASAHFLDPATQALRVLVTGGTDGLDKGRSYPVDLESWMGNNLTSSADVYTYSGRGPSDSVVSTQDMALARFGHTATWIPGNKVVVIGGAVPNIAEGVSLIISNSIEIYDPVTGQWSTAAAILPSSRALHTATLMPDGRIFICGGVDSISGGVEDAHGPLANLIYDPIGDQVSALTGNDQARVEHTATRTPGGAILIVGGRHPETGAIQKDGGIYLDLPDDGFSQWTDFALFSSGLGGDLGLTSHAATLLGNGDVMISGGVAQFGPGPEIFTNSVYLVDPVRLLDNPGPLDAFTPVDSGFMADNRSEHSATGLDSGSVLVVGGRNAPGTAPFLDSMEFFAFSNAVPTVLTPMTVSNPNGSIQVVRVEVQDADGDGGYVIIRYRFPAGSGAWKLATISQQTPSSGPFPNAPTMQVEPGTYDFSWQFGSDGLSVNDVADIQVLPVGVVLGSPANSTVQIKPLGP